MLSIDVDIAREVRLRVRHWPSGPDVPFLLVHGLSSNARVWDEVAGHLSAAGNPAYAVDLRSHGESSTPPDGYDTATAATDLAALAAALALPPAVVAGQSWGGNVVVRLAARHPDRVAALGLVDGGWIDPTLTFDSWDQCADALRPPNVDGLRASDLRTMLERSHPDWSAAAIGATMANLRVGSDGTLLRRLSITDHMRIVRSMWDDPPWPDFPAITIPVLLLPAVPAESAEPAELSAPAGGGDSKRSLVAKAAGTLTRARIKEFVGADHDLHAQHPGEVAADLLTLAREATR
jgi:pimeloyl-ACP methyl ester carboxylesterase